jgi:nucleotide-binding universal stress UspA family protein
MKIGGKIVVGLDGSTRSHPVLAEAVQLATCFDAELILVRVVTIPLEVPPEAFEFSPDKFLELLEKNARTYLDAQARELPRALRVRETVRTGVAWQAVCTVARDEKADLIVIGSHGYSGLDRILGTTAERIIDHADRNVLVVREPLRD